MHDWLGLFKDKTLSDGTPIEICQCSWVDTRVTVDARKGSKARAMVQCMPIHESHGRSKPQSMGILQMFIFLLFYINKYFNNILLIL
jgi:hypothetical protein